MHINKHDFFFLQCINSLRSLDAMQPAVCLNVVMMWLFIYCFFGDQVTNQFESLGPSLYQCNWYFLRLDFLTLLPFTILSTQKLIHVRGFGNSSCTRETFKKVNLNLNNFINLFNLNHILDRKYWIFLFHDATASKQLISSTKSLCFNHPKKPIIEEKSNFNEFLLYKLNST